MRISDWSSDVCSSDLLYDRPCRWAGGKGRRLFDLPRSAGVRRAGPERAPPRLPAAWHRRIGGRRVARAGLGHGRCDRARLHRDKTWVHPAMEWARGSPAHADTDRRRMANVTVNGAQGGAEGKGKI